MFNLWNTLLFADDINEMPAYAYMQIRSSGSVGGVS